MKTIIIILLCSAWNIFSATNLPPVIEKAPTELFRSGETQLDLNAFTRTDSRLADFNNGGGFGVNHFFTRNLGLGADFQAEDTSSAFFDRIGVAAIYRWPIGASRFAPEVKAGYSYDFERGDNTRTFVTGEKDKEEVHTRTIHDGNGHEVFAGAGGEWRFTKAFGLGAEARIVKPLDGRSEYFLGIIRGRFNF